LESSLELCHRCTRFDLDFSRVRAHCDRFDDKSEGGVRGRDVINSRDVHCRVPVFTLKQHVAVAA
jgi:hypothetical protein